MPRFRSESQYRINELQKDNQDKHADKDKSMHKMGDVYKYTAVKISLIKML